jgi:hypothetical protein
MVDSWYGRQVTGEGGYDYLGWEMRLFLCIIAEVVHDTLVPRYDSGSN